MNASCDFCTSTEIRKRIAYQDALVWVFPSQTPIVPGHLLVCPVRCLARLEDCTDEEFYAMRSAIRKCAAALRRVVGAEGFHYAWNDGAVAGQTVPHLHVHVVPRKRGDIGITDYEPRKFLYRPGTREVSPRAELQDIARRIAEVM